MTTTLPMRLQLWQSMGEIIPPGSPSGMISPISETHTISASSSPVVSPTSELSPIGTFDLIKSKSVLHASKTHRTLPYPTNVEPTSTPTPPQSSIRRVMSLMNLPSLDNRNTHTVYTPPSATRALASSPSWENLVQAHQQRMIDLRADQHRRRYRGITPSSYLYTGATYKGYQSVHHGGRDLSWNVSVRILGLDLRHGVCCGMMEARDIPGQKPGTVTTYWEGQIVDNINHCFFTGRWDITCQQDEQVWSKFVAYIPLRTLVSNQQPLVQTCYPIDGQPSGMNKPDETTADRIYAKLQQLKRLAQEPPPRMESCAEELETLSISQDEPESTCEETDVPAELEHECEAEPEPEPEVEPEHEPVTQEHEDLSESDASEPVINEDVEEECGYDEFASIASHHRLTRHLNRSQYIFMRWKEMSFDEQEKAKGFTIAGFYYVVMDRKDGSIIGIFHDQRSTCSQRLVLRHINRESSNIGQAFSEYHFH